MLRPLKIEDIPPIKSNQSTLHIPVVYKGVLRFIQSACIIPEQVILESSLRFHTNHFWEQKSYGGNYLQDIKQPPGQWVFIKDCELITNFYEYQRVCKIIMGEEDLDLSESEEIKRMVGIMQQSHSDMVMAMGITLLATKEVNKKQKP